MASLLVFDHLFSSIKVLLTMCDVVNRFLPKTRIFWLNMLKCQSFSMPVSQFWNLVVILERVGAVASIYGEFEGGGGGQ